MKINGKNGREWAGLYAYSLYELRADGIKWYCPKMVYYHTRTKRVTTVVVGEPIFNKVTAIRRARQLAKQDKVPFYIKINRGDMILTEK